MALSREQSISKYGTEAYTGWGETEAEADVRAHPEKKGTYNAGIQRQTPIDPTAYAREQQRILDEKLAKQEQVETGFLERFRSTVAGLEPLEAIRERTIQEIYPGYENLKQGATAAARQFELIPENVRARADQVGMSENRIRTRIGALQERAAPKLESLANQLATIGGFIQEAFQLKAADRENALLPLEQEASMISDRMSREITGYTNIIKSNIDLMAQQIMANKDIRVQELKDLAEQAKMESDYYNTDVKTDNGKIYSVNKRTGAINVLGTIPGYSGGGGGGDALTDLMNWAQTGTTSTGNMPGTNIPIYQSGGSIKFIP